jgi:Domain of unknown function (DUF222)
VRCGWRRARPPTGYGSRRPSTNSFPATLQALAAGDLTYWHARALVDGVAGLDPVTAAGVEQAVLAEGAQQPVGRFRATVAAAVLAVDPAPAVERLERAMSERCVRSRPGEDGMASVWALLPAEGAGALLAAVESLASVTSIDDPRTADQRRADALVDLGVAALHDPDLPRAQGMRPHIQVTIGLSTLLGLDEHPAQLAGHGAVPAEVGRRIAADPTGTWRRLVLAPLDGGLLDYGRSTYRPPADLGRFVIARDRECVFPHCRRSALHCDLDHQIRYADGGTTGPANTAPLCPRHHRCKDDGGWHVARQPDGSYTWTSPTGRGYRKRPPRYPDPPPDHALVRPRDRHAEHVPPDCPVRPPPF